MNKVENRKKLGDMLVELGYIEYDQLNVALKKQKITGKRLGEIFIEEKLISENDLLGLLEVQLGFQRVYIDMINVDMNAVTSIPEGLARKYNLLPLKFRDNELIVVMNDPLNIIAEEDVSIASGYKVKIVLSPKEEIRNAISKYYSEDYMKKTAEELKTNYKEIIENEDLTEEEMKNTPAVKLIDTIIENAVRNKASDIHIEPFVDKITIRYRVDGQLKKQFDSPKEPLGTMITRIKILGSMDIAEKRIPQDGRIFINIDGKEMDLRVSILPTVNGEKVVIRILDRTSFVLDKYSLGFTEEDLKKVNSIINKPYGIILVTGPTGSGKTTTLYSIMKDLNKEISNIITIEDPVEYTMDGINQVNVNVKAGLTFANGLRSILRQDPDIIMIGEIRDEETAEIAIRSAITGHLVLSTLHTNDAPSSIVRLIDMGIAPYLLASSLTGIISQRLVRKICTSCCESYEANDYEKSIMGIDKDEDIYIKKGKGCIKCSGTGYKGRMGIYEIINIDKDLREVIYRSSNLEDIKKCAINSEMKTLFNSTKQAVLRGDTTLEELMRITLLNE